MSETSPTDQELSDFRATCRAFLDEHATGISLSEPDPRDHATIAQNKAFQGLLADAGLAGLTYPKEYGGAGLTKAAWWTLLTQGLLIRAGSVRGPSLRCPCDSFG